GRLIARYGAARVVFIGGVILAVGLATTSRVTTLWQFYLCFGIVTAVGFSASGWIGVVTLLQSWFRRTLGTATGITSAGVGIGIMALIPVTQLSIQAYGWRTTYLGMAAVALAVVLPVAFLLREGPLARVRPGTTASDASSDPTVIDHDWVRRPWTLSLATRTGRYWYLLAAFFLASFASNQVMAHHVAYLRAAGVAAQAAATIVGIIGLASVPAKITWGALSDRIGREGTYTIGIAFVVAAIAVLWVVPASGVIWLPFLYATLIGAGYAVSATMPPLITADLFRGAGYAAIFGGISLATSSGSGIGTWLAGYIFDRTGSYHLAFIIAATGTMVSALCLWLAAPRHVRRAPGVRHGERSTTVPADHEAAAVASR
ncbi:MAG: MFS transporter, partial [Dehalococcoidia bacterium]